MEGRGRTDWYAHAYRAAMCDGGSSIRDLKACVAFYDGLSESDQRAFEADVVRLTELSTVGVDIGSGSGDVEDTTDPDEMTNRLLSPDGSREEGDHGDLSSEIPGSREEA